MQAAHGTDRLRDAIKQCLKDLEDCYSELNDLGLEPDDKAEVSELFDTAEVSLRTAIHYLRTD